MKLCNSRGSETSLYTPEMCTPIGPHGACRDCTDESTHTLTCCEGHSVSVCDRCFCQLIADCIRILKIGDPRGRLKKPQLYKRVQSNFANVTNEIKQVYTCGVCSKVLRPSLWPSYHRLHLPGPRSLPQKMSPGKPSKFRKALQAPSVSEGKRVIAPNAQRRLERKAREEEEEREKLRAELEAKREERVATLREEAARFASEQEEADRLREEKRAKNQLERAKKRANERPPTQSPPKIVPREEDDVKALREKLTLAVLQLKQAQVDQAKAEQRELSAVKAAQRAQDAADKMTQENHLLRQGIKDAEERATVAMKNSEETIGNTETLIKSIEKSASERAEQRIQEIMSSAEERVAAAEARADRAKAREESVNDLLKRVDCMVRARAAFELCDTKEENLTLKNIW
jgi:hypothetical protein